MLPSDILLQTGGEVFSRKLNRNKTSSSLVCITPLRMLLKKETDRRSFALMNMLMDHENEEGGKVKDKQINLQLVNAAIILQEASHKMDKFSQVCHWMISYGKATYCFPKSQRAGLVQYDGVHRDAAVGGYIMIAYIKISIRYSNMMV